MAVDLKKLAQLLQYALDKETPESLRIWMGRRKMFRLKYTLNETGRKLKLKRTCRQ